MQKKPLVSILIASYNKEKYVTRCINSCLTQTYNNIEIIFVDDGSTDSSYEKAKKYKKIKAIKNYTKKKLCFDPPPQRMALSPRARSLYIDTYHQQQNE